MMNKLFLQTVLLPLVVLTANSVLAEHNDTLAYAEVLNVKTLIHQVEITKPYQECWDEQVVHHRPAPKPSAVSTVLGAIIGGAIGNAVGHKKSNKRVGAVAGAVLGGAVGHSIGQQGAKDKRDSHHYVTEERCRTINETHHEERIMGYEVKYRYNGTIYHTQMDEHPGERIKIRVQVTPVN